LQLIVVFLGTKNDLFNAQENRNFLYRQPPGWYAVCLNQGVYVETQTKKLAQTIFLFSASSLCAILLCMAATTRHNNVSPQLANFPIYTFQNPFNLAVSVPSSTFSSTKGAKVLAKIFSVKGFLGLSGLGALWLASTWYLQGGWSTRKQINRKTNHPASEATKKMNPLAIIPKPSISATKQDSTCSVIVCETKTRCSFTHRKTTAPCQSRFRPLTLVSSQTRFGRLK